MNHAPMKQKRRTTARLIATACAMTLVTAACGSSDDASSQESAEVSDTPDVSDTSDDTPVDGSQDPTTEPDVADTGDSGGSGEVVTLTVSNLPPSTESGARDAFMERVDAFETEHPDIDIEPSEYEWDIATFGAQLAGGTLPAVFQIPFTDSQGLIAQGQVADITAEVSELPYAQDFNPSVLAVTQDVDGQIHGLPIAAYGIGLQYNRSLYDEAGLDPDSPPQTWDDVRSNAKAIADATGQAGFAQMSQSNTGGWMLTTLTYAFGGRMQEGTGDDVTSTINNEGTIQALELLQAMRWEDDSMGSNFLYDWGGINQAFSAGQIGMYMGGSDVYNSLVTENEIDPATYGLATLPLDGADAGVLGGGGIAAVRPDVSDAERAAAVEWIDFFYMTKLTSEDAARADAEASASNDAPVGTPSLPIFDAEQLALSDSWVAEFVNVPLDQMAPFKDGVVEQPLIPEPAVAGQEMYAILDTVVQEVLTDENADLGALLDDADEQVSALIAAN